MPVSGQSVLDRLRQALDEARAAATAVQAQGEDLTRRLDRLVGERGDVLLELARHYLPDLSRDTVAGTLGGIRDELRAIVDRQERQIAELRGRLARLAEPRDVAGRQHSEAAAALAVAVTRRDALQEEVARRLADDSEFQQLSRQAIETEAELGRNEERVREIERDAQEKLPAYERSRLFRYLRERHFGTPQYAHRGLTRRLDRWVAGLIDDAKARRSYEFLRVTPELMRQELKLRQEEFDRLMDRVEMIEQKAAADAGLPAAITDVERLTRERDRLAGQLDAAEQHYLRVEEELRAFEQSEGRFYDEALARLRRFLDQTESDVLQARARETPDPKDDELAARAAWLTTEIAAAQADLDRHREESRRAAAQAEGLDYAVRRFQQMDLNSTRSQFPDDLDLSVPLDRFRTGVIDQRQLLDEIRRHHVAVLTPAKQQAADLFSSPMAQGMLRAMVGAAGEAARRGAERSLGRRGRRW